MESFHSHKVSVGAELGLAAGPYGAGAIVESGKEMTPCWSYVKSRVSPPTYESSSRADVRDAGLLCGQ